MSTKKTKKGAARRKPRKTKSKKASPRRKKPARKATTRPRKKSPTRKGPSRKKAARKAAPRKRTSARKASPRRKAARAISRPAGAPEWTPVESYEAEIQSFAVTQDAETMAHEAEADVKPDPRESLDEDVRKGAERGTSQPPPDEEW